MVPVRASKETIHVMKITFSLKRQTKGAILYEELKADGTVCTDLYQANVGQLYIRKTSELGKKMPVKIVVTLEEVPL